MRKPEENYSPHVLVGLILTLITLAAVTIYWIGQPERLAQAEEDFTSERVRHGRQIYNEQCVSCHGAEGEGGVGPVLNSLTLLKNTMDDVFFSVIRSGVPNTQMPAWSVDYGGPLTDEDVRNVVAFMRAWEPTAPLVEPAVFEPSAPRGALLFNTTCAICHGENGQGSADAPAINNPERLASLDNDWYRATIRNGRPARGMPTWGTVLSPEQIEDIIALVDTWRQGGEVATPYDATTEIAAAIFSLQQGDPDSAAMRLSRALAVATGPGADILLGAQDQLRNGDTAGALATLQLLYEQWPIGNPVNGEALYAQSCAPCHGANGEGGVGLPLNPSPFTLQSTNVQMVEFIQSGRLGTAMVGFADRLSDADIADLVAFLRGWNPRP